MNSKTSLPPVETIFVVDDDRSMRASLQALLEALGFAVEVFASGKAFLKHYGADMPGCLIVDILMPEMDGITMVEQLLAAGRHVPVIFITAHASVQNAVAAMKTGAIEFLEKPFARERLEELVRRGLALDREWRTREAEFKQMEERLSKLKTRDRETLDLILAGHSNKVIAKKLLLTERAVEMRRAALLRKLEVHSVPELVDLTVTHRVHAELRAAKRL
jgi:two-component system response regulator TtrR